MKKPSGASASKGRSLFLSPESPFPAIGGGPIRSASLFEYLAERSQVDVITFRQPGESDPREAFPEGRGDAVYVVNLPAHSKSAPARAVRNLRRAIAGRAPLTDRFSGFERRIESALQGKKYRLAVVEHFWCAHYEPVLRRYCECLYLDLHNIESVWHAKLAASENPIAGLMHQRFGRASEALEKELLPRFDALLVTSTLDAERVRLLAPSARCIVYPNALPQIARLAIAERHVIVFSGNLEYQPNISAIRYFQRNIWPCIREKCPELIWEIIGKNPHCIRKLTKADSRIHVIGPLADAVERIASAKVAVVPLLAGSGTRIKILEAWAAGTAVVSTSIGAEGLEYRNEHNLIVADVPSAFSGAVVDLVSNTRKRDRIGLSGREEYEQRYTWLKAFDALDRNLTCW
jgi:glycosyltransferase involved in cell wall biosynthesis